ncbi:hypothetical protein ACROYT_G014171 [Oculina patagonica]
MYVTHGNHCAKLVVIDGRITATDETELHANQEEAGCDAMSSFAGKGKRKAFETVRDSQVMSDNVQVIGESLTISGQSITRLQEVVCMLYNDNRCKLVNDLGYKMFCKGKNVQSHQHPPTSAALRYHLKRANYQVFLWKKALQPRIEQEPVSHGWKLKEGCLEIVWTDLAPSPQAVMEIVCCGCRAIRQMRRCSCVGKGFPFTEACTCSENCMNSATDFKDGDDDVNDDDEHWTQAMAKTYGINRLLLVEKSLLRQISVLPISCC